MSSYGKTNELEGFDIDVGRAVAQALGVKVEFVTTETAQRVPFLVSNRIDIALGALTRTPQRAKLVSFTVPLHTRSDGRDHHRQGCGPVLAGPRTRQRSRS